MTLTLQGRSAPSGARMVGVLAGLALALLGASLAQRRGVAPAGAPRRRPPAAAKQAAALCGLQVHQHFDAVTRWALTALSPGCIAAGERGCPGLSSPGTTWQTLLPRCI